MNILPLGAIAGDVIGSVHAAEPYGSYGSRPAMGRYAERFVS